MTIASPAPGAPDLDGEYYNLAAARWNELHQCWQAPYHGMGSMEALELCGCAKCLDELTTRRRLVERERWRQEHPGERWSARACTVEVGPVREHLRALLDAGMSRTEVAVAAGVDRTTLSRVLRADVRRVHADTATALLAVGAQVVSSRP